MFTARCALLHSYGAKNDFHGKNSDAKFFAHHDGGLNMFDPREHGHHEPIGTAPFLNEVVIAMEWFLNAWRTDAALRACVEHQLARGLRIDPAPAT